MMGIRHGRAWIYILLSWDHQCEPGSLCPPYSPTPLYLESFPNLKKKKKAVAACLAGPHLNCYRHLHTGGAI